MAEPISALVSDPEAPLVRPAWVVVYAPQGGRRRRFPENCVTVHPDEATARAAACPAEGRYAAVAAGPSRSSEGFRLYYLIRWLD